MTTRYDGKVSQSVTQNQLVSQSVGQSVSQSVSLSAKRTYIFRGSSAKNYQEDHQMDSQRACTHIFRRRRAKTVLLEERIVLCSTKCWVMLLSQPKRLRLHHPSMRCLGSLELTFKISIPQICQPPLLVVGHVRPW